MASLKSGDWIKVSKVGVGDNVCDMDAWLQVVHPSPLCCYIYPKGLDAPRARVTAPLAAILEVAAARPEAA